MMARTPKRETLSDMALLAGQSETISMTDLRKAPGDILSQVKMGKTFTITRNGEILAVLSPPELSALELGAELRRMERVK